MKNTGPASFGHGEVKTEESKQSEETKQSEEGTQQEGEIKESAPTYSDTAGHWAKSYIDQAAELGIIEGESGNIYAPDKAITGQELIDAAQKAFGVDITVNADGNITRKDALKLLMDAAIKTDFDSHFAENYTSKENYWYAAFVDVLLEDDGAKYVAFGADMDIVDGYGNGTFGPNNKMTKAELAKIIIKMLEYQSVQ